MPASAFFTIAAMVATAVSGNAPLAVSAQTTQTKEVWTQDVMFRAFHNDSPAHVTEPGTCIMQGLRDPTSAEHDGIGAVKDGVGDIGHLCACRQRVVLHRCQHLMVKA